MFLKLEDEKLKTSPKYSNKKVFFPKIYIYIYIFIYLFDKIIKMSYFWLDTFYTPFNHRHNKGY